MPHPEDGQGALAAGVVEDLLDVAVAVEVEDGEGSGAAVGGVQGLAGAVGVERCGDGGGTVECVVCGADGVGGGVEERVGVLGEGLPGGGLPVGLVGGVGPVACRAGQCGQQDLGGEDTAGLLQQVAVEVVAGGLGPASFVVGVVGAAEEVSGCRVGRGESGFGLVVAVDEGLAEGRGPVGGVAGPHPRGAAQGVDGRQPQSPFAVAAFDSAAGGVEHDAGGAGVDELLPPGASLQVVYLLGGGPAERVGDLQEVAVDVVRVVGDLSRGRGSFGVLDDAAERVEQGRWLGCSSARTRRRNRSGSVRPALSLLSYR